MVAAGTTNGGGFGDDGCTDPYKLRRRLLMMDDAGFGSAGQRQEPETIQSEIKCRIGSQVKYNSQSNTMSNVYGMEYKSAIKSGNPGERKTMKVVACSYQTMFENAQVSLMSVAQPLR